MCTDLKSGTRTVETAFAIRENIAFVALCNVLHNY